MMQVARKGLDLRTSRHNHLLRVKVSSPFLVSILHNELE